MKLKITVCKEDGEVLDTLLVDVAYLQGTATYPEYMGAQVVRETLEDNFEVTEA